MEIAYLTVEALTKYVKRKFDADPYLREVYVKGELSNVKLHSSGHIYFTLKDEFATIDAAMFRAKASRLSFRPENGMQVFIKGFVNVYEQRGTYQLYVDQLEPDGVGGLHVAFEQLKTQLAEEGLFNDRFKQPIVKFPKTIGIVTAPTGAAIRDILTTLKQYYPLAKVIIFPALVQGKQAAPSIVEAIEKANTHGFIDTLIIGRGGGSIEDLWAFNEESVARAIFESRIPIISGVGHETDTTIADFVADFRAPTPTGAAKRAVPDKNELMESILVKQTQIFQMVQQQLRMERERLVRLQQSVPLQYPERLYRPFVEKLHLLDDQLHQRIKRQVEEQALQIERLQNRLMQKAPQRDIQFAKQKLETLEQQLQKSIQHYMKKEKNRFVQLIRTFEAVNPLSIMARGYSIVYNKEDHIVKSATQVVENEPLTIRLSEGEVDVVVQKVRTGGDSHD